MAKSAFLAAAILILILTFAALLPNLSDDEQPSGYQQVIEPVETSRDPLESFRLNRSQVRKEELEQLMTVMTSSDIAEEIRLDAGKMRLELINNMESEATIEGILTARGFEDVVCTVHRDSVNVLVRADSVTRDQSAVIMELAIRETGQSARNIKIIPVDE
ncbi:MAG: SpoIIIAH-like family protein [Clostridia bacterium]|nr:SpoIIIAH-like family protein [Clostridia bacterium]